MVPHVNFLDKSQRKQSSTYISESQPFSLCWQTKRADPFLSNNEVWGTPGTQIFFVIRTNFLWIYLKSFLKWSGHTLLEGCLKISMCVYLQIDNSREPSNKNNFVVTLEKWQRKPDLRTIALQKNTSTPSVALFMWLFSKHHML